MLANSFFLKYSNLIVLSLPTSCHNLKPFLNDLWLNEQHEYCKITRLGYLKGCNDLGTEMVIAT